MELGWFSVLKRIRRHPGHPMNRASRVSTKRSWTLSKKLLSSLFPPATRPPGLLVVRSRDR